MSTTTAPDATAFRFARPEGISDRAWEQALKAGEDYMRTVTTRPHWSEPGQDNIDRDEKTHPADRGVWYRSAAIDRWMAEDGSENGEEEIEVYIDGFRHDADPTSDWPDTVAVRGGCMPGYSGGVTLRHDDALRLAEAISAACKVLKP